MKLTTVDVLKRTSWREKQESSLGRNGTRWTDRHQRRALRSGDEYIKQASTASFWFSFLFAVSLIHPEDDQIIGIVTDGLHLFKLIQYEKLKEINCKPYKLIFLKP